MIDSLAALPTRYICNEIESYLQPLPHKMVVPQNQGDPYTPGQGTRLRLSKSEGSGYCDYLSLSKDLKVNICNRVSMTDISANFISEGYVKFHYRLSGTSEVIFENGQKISMEGPICGVLAQPPGAPKGEICFRHSCEKWMTVLCSPEYIEHQLHIREEQLPKQLRLFVTNNSLGLFQANLSLDRAMQVALTDLLNTQLTGDYRALYTEGKVLELLALTLHKLCDGNNEQLSYRASSSRELNRVSNAIDMVHADFTKTPLLSEVASQLGTNSSRLNALFKQQLGLTYGQYVVDQRMRRAHDLLRGGDMTITEIAFEVGYQWPANFSNAFKRYFGVSPKSFFK